MSRSRKDVLVDLVRLTRPPLGLGEELRTFPWDSEGEIVMLTVADIRRALEKYLRGELALTDITEWTELLEGRDDIGLQRAREETLKQFLFEVANQGINVPLDRPRAEEWLSRLRGL